MTMESQLGLGIMQQRRFLTIRGCILGIKKEAPRKTGRFLHFAGVGAGFLLSRTAAFFTAEDSSSILLHFKFERHLHPGTLQPGIKCYLKTYLVAFQMLGLLMTLVNTFRPRPLDIYCQYVGDGWRRDSWVGKPYAGFNEEAVERYCQLTENSTLSTPFA